jgi:hypothetical protein
LRTLIGGSEASPDSPDLTAASRKSIRRHGRQAEIDRARQEADERTEQQREDHLQAMRPSVIVVFLRRWIDTFLGSPQDIVEWESAPS